MKELKEILYKVKITKVIGNTSIGVSKLCIDSRQIKSNNLFIAIKGNSIDGHNFINKAIELGAKSIICESMPPEIIDGITYLEVNCSREALSITSANYFDNPSKKLKLIGVTGTNGKTTITTLLFDLFKIAGFKTGLISTVKICIDQNEISSTQTTPDSLLINSLLNQMLENGVEYCFMEISSHGIHQKRINGLNFSGGIFSNLSHDHLDYHSTFSNYRDIKKEFFDNLPKESFSLINKDDKNGKFMTQNTKSKVFYYALNSYADFKIKILEKSIEGMLLKIDQTELWTNLSGKFNAYNLLSVISAATLLGIPKDKALEYALIARKIVEARLISEIKTTLELNNLLLSVLPKKRSNKLLAQIYQSLRIEVNSEIDVIKSFLIQTKDVLRQKGRLSVISYHSLEDRLVKRFIRSGLFQGDAKKDIYGNENLPFSKVGKLIVPTYDEIKLNNRARSAKLRIAEKN